MDKRLNRNSDPGQTPLEDISGLIPGHISTREALNRAEFDNITRAHTRYFLGRKAASKKSLNVEGLLKLHAEMFGQVWQWAGKIRTRELSLGRPPAKIGADLHELVYDLHRWEKEKMDPLEIAVRLHHRLVWIHPFAGGNGRWARTAANIYLAKNSLELIQWPADQMTAKSKLRKEYIAALRKADGGDFSALLRLHRLHR